VRTECRKCVIRPDLESSRLFDGTSRGIGRGRALLTLLVSKASNH